MEFIINIINIYINTSQSIWLNNENLNYHLLLKAHKNCCLLSFHSIIVYLSIYDFMSIYIGLYMSKQFNSIDSLDFRSYFIRFVRLFCRHRRRSFIYIKHNNIYNNPKYVHQKNRNSFILLTNPIEI